MKDSSTQHSILEIHFRVQFQPGMTFEEEEDELTDYVPKSFNDVWRRVEILPTNRVDDFPGTSRFAVRDYGFSSVPTEGHTGVLEVAGDGDWLTREVARQLKDICVEALQRHASEFRVAHIERVIARSVKQVVTQVTEDLEI